MENFNNSLKSPNKKQVISLFVVYLLGVLVSVLGASDSFTRPVFQRGNGLFLILGLVFVYKIIKLLIDYKSSQNDVN